MPVLPSPAEKPLNGEWCVSALCYWNSEWISHHHSGLVPLKYCWKCFKPMHYGLNYFFVCFSWTLSFKATAVSLGRCVRARVCVISRFSCVRLFVTPWTVAHQSPLPMKFSRQEYRSGLPFPSAGDLPHPGIKLTVFCVPCIAGRFLPLSQQGKDV